MSEGTIDVRLIRRLNGYACSSRYLGLMRLASRLGDGPIWYILIAAVTVGEKFAGWTGVHLALLGLCNTLIYYTLKVSLKRARPFATHQGIRALAEPMDAYSLPSGHTMHAVAFAIAASSFYPALALVLAPFAALTAVSRVALGLHYPSDVLLGAIIGAATAAVSLSLV
ncbi:MAG: phosphatase PAP2 family protein [Lysobacteraceae bacterium]|nr:MAG: phosphatase PAP2 family protein [Xanthomonadaceae bacterium]